MNEPRALVLTGYGLNCDGETRHALSLSGFRADLVHISQLTDPEAGSPEKLEEYHLLAVIGGFSWGDDHGAGVILGTRLRYRLKEELDRFIAAGKLVIGICNGFQCLVNMGLLPGLDGDYGTRRVALIHNDAGNFRDDWVRLRVNVESPCVFTKGLNTLDLPVRHGEGKFVAPPEVLERLQAANQLALFYAAASGERAEGRFPDNPNGSLLDVAGLCDPSGRLFGLMPHPEAYHHWTNHPDWTLQREWARREGKAIEKEGAGIKLFRNACAYVREKILNGVLE
jgi:phosphoribosylformylglycinamidine synthase subunit PurQ / glutaminase